MNKILKKRWAYLAMSVIFLLFMGIGYAFSIFVVPIENDLGLVRSQTSLVFTLCFICFSLGSFIGGFLIRKIKPQYLMRIISALIAFGFISSTFATKAYHLYFSYSICCGFSIGVIYNICVSVLPLYFQDKLGLATGILLMGYAMSTTLFGQLCEIGITTISWKGVFFILGIGCFVVLMLGSFLIHYPIESEKNALPAGQSKTEQLSVDYHPLQVIKSPTFYIFIFIYIFIGGIGMSLINHMAPVLSEELFVSSALTATLVSIISLFNGIGRVVWGSLFDKKGISASYKMICFLLVISLILMILAMKYNIILLFVVGGSCAMFCYGGSSSLAPIVVRYLYGNEYFSINFSITNIGTLILSTFPTFIGSIQLLTHHYLIGFIVLFVFSVGSLILSYLYLAVAKKELKKY